MIVELAPTIVSKLAPLTAGRAVLYTATTGSYAGQNFLVVDGDGIAGYTEGADFVILIQDSNINRITIDDFI